MLWPAAESWICPQLNDLFVDCMTMTVRLTIGWVGLCRNFLIKWWVGLGWVSKVVGWVGFENWTHGHVCIYEGRRTKVKVTGVEKRENPYSSNLKL